MLPVACASPPTSSGLAPLPAPTTTLVCVTVSSGGPKAEPAASTLPLLPAPAISTQSVTVTVFAVRSPKLPPPSKLTLPSTCSEKRASSFANGTLIATVLAAFSLSFDMSCRLLATSIAGGGGESDATLLLCITASSAGATRNADTLAGTPPPVESITISVWSSLTSLTSHWSW